MWKKDLAILLVVVSIWRPVGNLSAYITAETCNDIAVSGYPSDNGTCPDNTRIADLYGGKGDDCCIPCDDNLYSIGPKPYHCVEAKDLVMPRFDEISSTATAISITTTNSPTLMNTPRHATQKIQPDDPAKSDETGVRTTTSMAPSSPTTATVPPKGTDQNDDAAYRNDVSVGDDIKLSPLLAAIFTAIAVFAVIVFALSVAIICICKGLINTDYNAIQ